MRNEAEWRFTLLDSRTQGTKAVSAHKVIRTINGTSGACLVSGDDGKLYTVRFAGDASQPNALANELLGTTLAQAMKLPVPSAVPMLVTPDFLKESACLLSIGQDDSAWPRPGLHCGISFVGEVSGPNRPIQYLNRRQIGTISNRADFLKMYIFDIWANQAISRDALFLRDGETPSYRAVFINNSRLFGFSTSHLVQDKTLACHRNKALYSGLWDAEAVSSIIESFQAAIPPALDAILPLIPNDWHSGNLNSLHTALRQRLNELPKVIEVHSLADGSVSKGMILDDELRLRGSGVC